MSVQITTAFVEQYKGNVEHLVQQKASRLRPAVSVETVVGKNAFFEQIGATNARIRTTRHAIRQGWINGLSIKNSVNCWKLS